VHYVHPATRLDLLIPDGPVFVTHQSEKNRWTVAQCIVRCFYCLQMRDSRTPYCITRSQQADLATVRRVWVWRAVRAAASAAAPAAATTTNAAASGAAEQMLSDAAAHCRLIASLGDGDGGPSALSPPIGRDLK
jgi:hypothetical protein